MCIYILCNIGDRLTAYMLFMFFFISGFLAYNKLSGAMLKKAFVKGIKQASPLDQTSCLEGFHSVVNHFAPKMNAYSFTGIYCR